MLPSGRGAARDPGTRQQASDPFDRDSRSALFVTRSDTSSIAPTPPMTRTSPTSGRFRSGSRPECSCASSRRTRRERVVLLEEIEAGERHGTCKRIRREGVAVEERARAVVASERRVHGFRCAGRAERQVARGERFRQADDVGRDLPHARTRTCGPCVRIRSALHRQSCSTPKRSHRPGRR